MGPKQSDFRGVRRWMKIKADHVFLRSGSVTSGLRRAADPSVNRERAVAAQCERDELGELGKVGLDAGLPNLRVAEVGTG